MSSRPEDNETASKSEDNKLETGIRVSEETSYFIEGADNQEIDIQSNQRDRFTNIRPLYESETGPTRLLSAHRYGKRYVLKTLKEGYRNEQLYRQALRKEFEIGINLDHPNIRRTIGYEDIPGVGESIILEYVDGEALSDSVSNGKVTRENVRLICRQIAEALQYLHAKQVIHRDLKPRNILLTYTGEVVKLIDFGLSDSETFLIVKNPGGTKSYMAPEQREKGIRPSVESDIYSLGKVVSELGQHTGDKELSGIGAKCSKIDPRQRPHSIIATGLLSLSEKPKEKIMDLGSRRLTRLLLIILGLLIIAVYILTNKLHN